MAFARWIVKGHGRQLSNYNYADGGTTFGHLPGVPTLGKHTREEVTRCPASIDIGVVDEHVAIPSAWPEGDDQGHAGFSVL